MSPEIQTCFSIASIKSLISILKWKVPKYTLKTYLLSIQDAVFSMSLTGNSILPNQNLASAFALISHIPLPIHQQILLVLLSKYILNLPTSYCHHCYLAGPRYCLLMFEFLQETSNHSLYFHLGFIQHVDIRVILRKPKSDQITPLFKSHLCLPVLFRVKSR